MIDFKMDIKGLREMEGNLRKLGAQLAARTLRGALRDAAKPLEDHMKQNAPVSKHSRFVTKKSGERVLIEPGFLKSRIKRRTALNKTGSNRRKFGKNDVAVVKTGVFRVPYVLQVEYGTRNNKAHAFIRGAKSAAPEAIQIFSKRLKRRTELAARRLARKGK